MLHLRRGEWELAAGHLQDALAGLDAGAEASSASLRSLRSQLYADWSLAEQRLGRGGEALALAERAHGLALEAGDRRALAQAENMLGMLARARGDTAGAVRHLESSLELAVALDDPALRAAALNNLALAYADTGEYARAVELTRSALALVRTVGDRHREAALYNNLADLLHRQGDHDGAMSHLKRAVAIFADIRVEADTLQPEIWKLSAW
jgi:tetratricopeptide (TPR) repeat protein